MVRAFGSGAVAVGDLKGVLGLYAAKRGSLERISAKRIHGFSPITSLAYSSSHLSSVGEDGSLCVLDMSRAGHTMRKYEKIDSCSLNDVIFLRDSGSHLVWTAGSNPCAHLQLWDVRTASSTGEMVMSPSQWEKDVDSYASHNCIAQHQSEPHILISGSSSGHVCFWDVRKGGGGGGGGGKNERNGQGLIASHRFHTLGAVRSLEVVPGSHSKTCLLSCGDGGQLSMTDVDQCVYGQLGARAIASRVIHRNTLALNCVVTHVSEDLSNDRRIFVASSSEEITSMQFKPPSSVSSSNNGSGRLAIGDGSSGSGSNSNPRRMMMALRDAPSRNQKSGRGGGVSMSFGDF